MKKCKKCEKEFKTTGYNNHYCSKECRIKVKNENRRKSPQNFKCIICGVEFIQKRKDNLVCSSLCSQKLWVKNNPEKNWNRKNGEQAKKRIKKWRTENMDKIRSIKKRYKEKRRLNDIKFKLNELIGNSIRLSIKDKGFKKWSLILNYDVETLKNHLKKTLPKDVTWEIYLKSNNEFHIDHIIPISAYKFESYNDEEFKKCWNYRNLRIISKKENLTKLSKIEIELIKKYDIKDLLPNNINSLSIERFDDENF
jgi:DNA-directed RNA polymerase subunit RPC12/RpoP